MDAILRLRLWAFGLLLMLGLTACGTAEQPAGGNAEQPTGSIDQTSSTAAAPTRAAGQPPTPALRVHQTAVSAPPKPAWPTAGTATPPTITSRADGWQLYQNNQAGFSVAFPPDWNAMPGLPDETSIVVSFAPAGGAGIQIAATPGDPPAVRQSEQPSLVCERVTVGSLTGTRCVDSRTGSIATTLAGKGRTFVVATMGENMDTATYDRILDSFTLLA